MKLSLTIRTVALLFLSIASCATTSAAIAGVPSNNLPSAFWSQMSGDFALDQKTCFGVQIGFDYLQNNMQTIFDQYISRWNVDSAKQTVQNKNTFVNTLVDGKQLKIRKIGNTVLREREGGRIEYTQAFEAYDFHDEEEKILISDNFVIIMEIEKVKIDRETENGEEYVPQIRLRGGESDGKVREMARAVLDFEEASHWDRPSGMRLLTGLIRTANEYSFRFARSTYMELRNRNLNVMLDCDKDAALKVRSRPIAPNLFEFSMANNVVEFLFPSYYKLDLQEIISSNSELKSQLDNLNLGGAAGALTFTTNPDVLGRLDNSNLQKTGFNVIPEQKYDAMKVKKLDLIESRHNMFLQFQEENSDLTIIPIEFSFDFYGGFRQGIGSRYGPSQEMATELIDIKIEMKECQFIKNQDRIEEQEDQDDDDDFDEDEDEEATSSPKRSALKIPAVAKLGCSMRELINTKIKEQDEMVKKTAIMKIKDYTSPATLNVWYMFLELEYPFQLLCAGIELRHPQSRFERDRAVLQVEMKKNPLRIDEYCDNKWQELDKLDPRLIYEHEESMEEIKKELHLKSTSQFHLFNKVLNEVWQGSEHHSIRIASPLVRLISSHFPYEDWCKEKHPDVDPTICASVYFFLKPQGDYDKIMDWDRTYFDYTDERSTRNVMIYQRLFSRWILYIGLLLYLLRIQINPTVMLWFVFLFNMSFQMTSLWMPFRRFGPDTFAYVNQAGQFISGQTDYSQISSIQGPCYYPAGHLWHYVPIYKLFIYTDKGEYILKFLHFIIHSVIMTVVGKLSFRYFKNELFKAQLVCMMLVANEEMREINQLLFNDSILALYVVLCIYFVSGNRPLLAAQMLTMAMSIKAGAMLLVPSFLGCIQYQWGTLKLVMVLVIIVAWQILVASPFLFDSVALAMGFQNGAGTKIQTYVDMSKLLGGGAEAKFQRGAAYNVTIYWQFVGYKIYHEQWFVQALTKFMLGSNVYYFFIRRWCVPQCLYNLAKTFNPGTPSLTFAQRRKLIELMIIMYLAGVNFVPGGHQQFQLWYQDLMPIAIMMTGLPAVFTFSLFHDIYPARLAHPNVQHIFALGLSFILLTVGPRQIYRSYSQVEQKKNKPKKAKKVKAAK